MPRLDYGYVRSWDDPSYLQQLAQQGYGGALFEMDDPRLPSLVETARQLGLPYGIWGAPNQTPSGNNLTPQQFAQAMAAVTRKYGTTTAALDLEFPYKGHEGSPGWAANQELANYWKQLAPGYNTIITPMGSQWAGQSGNVQDFNFDAWKGIASGWNPQAYGAMLTDHQDPNMVVKALINAGIDPSMIAPVLAPGQTYGGGALYGLNEYGQLPKVTPQVTQAPAGGGPVVPTTTSTTPVTGNSIGDQVKHMAQRLSQSQQQVAQGGLKWYGQTYSNPTQFAKALAQHGANYQTWALNHPQAALGLAARRTGGKT